MTVWFSFVGCTNQRRGMVVSSGVVRWDSSLLCGSEQLWSCCYPQCSGMIEVSLSGSLGLFLGWTPNPSVLSALEGNVLNEDEFACARCFHESCAVSCAPQC